MHSLMLSMQVIAKVNEIVESSWHIQLDKDSYNYCRFATNLRYLIERLQAGVIPSVAVKCVDIRRNSSGEGGLLDCY